MRVRINPKPTEEQREIIKKEFDKLLDNFNHDTFVQIAHYFHFERGFGQKRLEDLIKGLKTALNRIHSRYEMSESDTTWICEKKLRDAHIDVDKLLGE
jgi:hypothetical protein